MPTTTNNGWTTPADTDLVKDGAAAIRTLGNAIDSTIGVYAAPGLTLINTTNFTAQSSVSLNNVFSSTYDNYKIKVSNLTCAAGSPNIEVRLRKAGTDNSSNIYIRQYLDANNATVGAGRVTATVWLVGLAATTNINGFFDFDLYNPNNASLTTGLFGAFPYNGSSLCFQPYNGFHNLASSADFDGFSLLPSASTISGTVSVYGFKK